MRAGGRAAGAGRGRGDAPRRAGARAHRGARLAQGAQRDHRALGRGVGGAAPALPGDQRRHRRAGGAPRALAHGHGSRRRPRRRAGDGPRRGRDQRRRVDLRRPRRDLLPGHLALAQQEGSPQARAPHAASPAAGGTRAARHRPRGPHHGPRHRRQDAARAAGLPASGRLDIEAITAREGALLIGLKSPLSAQGGAVVLRLAKPVEALAAGSIPPGALSRLWEVPLHVQEGGKPVAEGISDMTVLPDGTLICSPTRPRACRPTAAAPCTATGRARRSRRCCAASPASSPRASPVRRRQVAGAGVRQRHAVPALAAAAPAFTRRRAMTRDGAGAARGPMSSPSSLSLSLSLSLAMAASCYRPQPYDARSVLAELREQQPGRGHAAGGAGSAGGPLSADEAVERALRDNPDLRAARYGRGIAEGEVVAARAVANPTVDLQLLRMQALPGLVSWAIEAGWEPPQPEIYMARRAAARANLTRCGPRSASASCSGGGGARGPRGAGGHRRAARHPRRGAGGAAAHPRAGGAAGGRRRLDAGSTSAWPTWRWPRWSAIVTTWRRARSPRGSSSPTCSACRAPPRSAARCLEAPGAPPDLAALEEQAMTARPALAAAGARCMQREQSLRLEHGKRWPWFRFSAVPRYRANEIAQYPSDFSIGVQVVLPIFDRRGPIQVAEWAREQEHERLRKLVADVRASWPRP